MRLASIVSVWHPACFSHNRPSSTRNSGMVCTARLSVTKRKSFRAMGVDMQRINAIDPQTATGTAKTLLDGVQRKLGFVPNFMSTLAVSPATRDAYLSFNDRLSHGILSPKLREQLALTVANSNSCE